MKPSSCSATSGIGPHTTTDGKMDFQMYLSKRWVLPQENNPKKYQRMYTKRSDSNNGLKFLPNDVQDWATATGRTWSVLKLHFYVIIFGTLYLSITLTFMFVCLFVSNVQRCIPTCEDSENVCLEHKSINWLQTADKLEQARKGSNYWSSNPDLLPACVRADLGTWKGKDS